MMNGTTITAARYYTDPQGNGDLSGIKATINGIETFVPLDSSNDDYAEILRQVAAGDLTIQDAD